MSENRELQSLRVNTNEVTTTPREPVAEPVYPVLDKSEVWYGETDYRARLLAKGSVQLRPEETVVHMRTSGLQLPTRPVTPMEILMKAASASTSDEIGYHGPTVASVNIFEGGEASRYQRQHGRDDLIAGDDVKGLYPKLLDTVVVSLAASQGMEDEAYIPGQPYGFEKPGSIILVNFPLDDPLGKKFLKYKGWKPRFYGSADAPGLFVNAVADLQAADPAYLFKRTYDALDGRTYEINHAFDLSVKWLVDRMDENAEGLVEYRNPFTKGQGMRNQGWKDSADAMVHTNGDWVNSGGGVAPIEIQCQTVLSVRKAAQMYRHIYKNERLAGELEERAANLSRFILEYGWVQDAHGGYFAMGWDRDDSGTIRRIETRSIDMHSVLRLLDMADPDQKHMAWQTVRTLVADDMFTRWGSRVMSSQAKAYGHLRYHCGVWPDKSNQVAESMSSIGLFGLDRWMGQRTTALISFLGCIPEHISGQDSEFPILPSRDAYVYNSRYDEVYLAEQMPPLGQTWGASSEIGKAYRYGHCPRAALETADRSFESSIIQTLAERHQAMSVAP